MCNEARIERATVHIFKQQASLQTVERGGKEAVNMRVLDSAEHFDFRLDLPLVLSFVFERMRM
jgi:hypothetical protein